MSYRHEFALLGRILGCLSLEIDRLLQSEAQELLETTELLEATGPEETITMSVITTNDNSVRIRPSGTDRDGVAVPATSFTVEVDQPTVASVVPDPANPGAWLVTPLAAADSSVGARTVSVTVSDAAGNKSTPISVEFDPGVETSITVQTEIVPQASSGGTVQLGDTITIPGVDGDQTVTAISADGTIETQPADTNASGTKTADTTTADTTTADSAVLKDPTGGTAIGGGQATVPTAGGQTPDGPGASAAAGGGTIVGHAGTTGQASGVSPQGVVQAPSPNAASTDTAA